MSTRFLTEKDKNYLLNTLDGFSKEIDERLNGFSKNFGTKEELNQLNKSINDKLTSNYYSAKTIDDKIATHDKNMDDKIVELRKTTYSKTEIDRMFGSYVEVLASLIGGIEL